MPIGVEHAPRITAGCGNDGAVRLHARRRFAPPFMQHGAEIMPALATNTGQSAELP